MKSIVFFSSLLALSFSLINCEDTTEELNPDDLLGQQELLDNEENDNEPVSQAIPRREFPLVATLNQSPTNFFSVTPSDNAVNFDFLDATAVIFNTFDNPSTLNATYGISLIINREDLKLGNIQLSFGAGLLGSSGILLNDTRSTTTILAIQEGNISIDQIDSTQGIVAGTFNAEYNITNDGVTSTGETVSVTDGSFRFTYEVR